jgi:hypothetical protein
MLSGLRALGYDIMARNHALAILGQEFPEELRALVDILEGFRIHLPEIIGGGGGEAVFTQRLRRELSEAGWPKHVFKVQTIVDGVEREGISHEIDHVCKVPQGTLALEIEWNNKDPFYDRDLENFQRLHALSAVSVGLIVTRGRTLQSSFRERIEARLVADGVVSEEGLQAYGIEERTVAQRRAVERMVAQGKGFAEAFTANFVSSKFGQATTHWDKLEARVSRGVGNPCPLLLLGLPDAILVD